MICVWLSVEAVLLKVENLQKVVLQKAEAREEKNVENDNFLTEAKRLIINSFGNDSTKRGYVKSDDVEILYLYNSNKNINCCFTDKSDKKVRYEVSYCYVNKSYTVERFRSTRCYKFKM